MTIIQAQRTKNYIGPVTNTDIWSDFALRPNDVIVDTHSEVRNYLDAEYRYDADLSARVA